MFMTGRRNDSLLTSMVSLRSLLFCLLNLTFMVAHLSSLSYSPQAKLSVEAPKFWTICIMSRSFCWPVQPGCRLSDLMMHFWICPNSLREHRQLELILTATASNLPTKHRNLPIIFGALTVLDGLQSLLTEMGTFLQSAPCTVDALAEAQKGLLISIELLRFERLARTYWLGVGAYVVQQKGNNIAVITF